MIHYHGTPITPKSVFAQLAGRHFCVSFATGRGAVVKAAHEIGQSVMLDNGAFSFWRSGVPTDWDAYMDWVEPWLDYPTTWAVIPDVIGGTEEENDLLLVKWFQRRLPKGAPVWHMHESLDRLMRLCHGYERVCIGSSAEYSKVGNARWHRRMELAMNEICGSGPVPVWLHMLRGMALGGSIYPFASVDSTDIARNHNRPQNTAPRMADRWDARQNPAHWVYRDPTPEISTGEPHAVHQPARPRATGPVDQRSGRVAEPLARCHARRPAELHPVVHHQAVDPAAR